MLDFLHELVREQIAALDSSTKVVFIQPSYLPQHAVLTMVLQEPDCLYLHAGNQGLALRENLKQALIAQVANADLASVRLLILDECDRAIADEVESMLLDLLQQPRLRILILSRLVPDFLRTNDVIRDQTRIIPNDPALMFPDYLAISQSTLLEVRALGTGHVLLNGIPVTDWDGELPRNLFFYLIDRGMATRAQIFDAFWPDLSVHEATNVFHVTKRKINEILGMDITYYSGGFYRIASGIDLMYDVALFKDLMQQSAIETKSTAQALLTRAIRMYRGDFLTGLDLKTNRWVQTRRDELSQLYGEALFAQGKLAEQSGNLKVALGLFIRASALNRQREDLAGIIMGLYRDLGMFADALQTYDRIEYEISTTLGISPAQWLQDLAANIRTHAKTVAAKISQ